jgi:hypothetical protein
MHSFRTFLFAAIVLAAPAARAATVFTVDVDTSSLSGDFSLDFILIGSLGNTVTPDNFQFGTGTPGPTPSPLPAGVTGSLAGGVTLTDSAGFFIEFQQPFTAGSFIQFTASVTDVGPPEGGFPDNFSFSLLDQNLNPLPTTDPFGTDTLFSVDLTGDTLAPQQFQLIPSASVPEPQTGVLFISAISAVWLVRRRRMAKAAAASGPQPIGR